MDFIERCMGLLKDVRAFPWCMGVWRGTGVNMRGTGASSFCVTNQPLHFGVQNQVAICNYFFFINYSKKVPKYGLNAWNRTKIPRCLVTKAKTDFDSATGVSTPRFKSSFLKFSYVEHWALMFDDLCFNSRSMWSLRTHYEARLCYIRQNLIITSTTPAK